MWQVFGMLYEMFQKDGIDYFTGEKIQYKALLAARLRKIQFKPLLAARLRKIQYKALLTARFRLVVGLMNDGNLHLITVMSFCQTL